MTGFLPGSVHKWTHSWRRDIACPGTGCTSAVKITGVAVGQLLEIGNIFTISNHYQLGADGTYRVIELTGDSARSYAHCVKIEKEPCERCGSTSFCYCIF